MKNQSLCGYIALLALLCATATPALADDVKPTPRPRSGAFALQTGEELYKGVCQGCHMPDARGAVGAGMYPSLAQNENLESAGYPALVVLKGQKAMPDFGASFSDEQVANVVNYIRTHFGNRYRDKVTAADIHALR